MESLQPVTAENSNPRCCLSLRPRQARLFWWSRSSRRRCKRQYCASAQRRPECDRASDGLAPASGGKRPSSWRHAGGVRASDEVPPTGTGANLETVRVLRVTSTAVALLLEPLHPGGGGSIKTVRLTRVRPTGNTGPVSDGVTAGSGDGHIQTAALPRACPRMIALLTAGEDTSQPRASLASCPRQLCFVWSQLLRPASVGTSKRTARLPRVT
jgi:hypothetical protein